MEPFRAVAPAHPLSRMPACRLPFPADMEDRTAEPVTLPADPWEGVEPGFVWQRRRRPGRALFLVMVALFLAVYAAGVVYLVVAAEW